MGDLFYRRGEAREAAARLLFLPPSAPRPGRARMDARAGNGEPVQNKTCHHAGQTRYTTNPPSFQRSILQAAVALTSGWPGRRTCRRGWGAVRPAAGKRGRRWGLEPDGLNAAVDTAHDACRPAGWRSRRGRGRAVDRC